MQTDPAHSSCQLLLPRLEGEGRAPDAAIAAAAICEVIKCVAEGSACKEGGRGEGTHEMSQQLQLRLQNTAELMGGFLFSFPVPPTHPQLCHSAVSNSTISRRTSRWGAVPALGECFPGRTHHAGLLSEWR